MVGADRGKAVEILGVKKERESSSRRKGVVRRGHTVEQRGKAEVEARGWRSLRP